MQAIEASADTQFTYADGLARLYEFIARIIDEQQSLVEQHFGITCPRLFEYSKSNTHFVKGTGSMVVVIKNLQQQCDVHATKILSLFSQDTGMLKIVKIWFP